MNQINADSNIDVVVHALKYNKFLNSLGGFVVVVNNKNVVIGVISDSDLRKIFLNRDLNLVDLKARDLMQKDFIFLTKDEFESKSFTNLTLKIESRKILNKHTVNFIPVLDKNHKLLRILHITDLLENWNESESQIVIVGLGYVGLTLALAFAERGRPVIGIDSNVETIKMLKKGKTRIHEPEIEKLLSDKIKSHLTFSDTFAKVARSRKNQIRHYIVSVGTPMKKDNLIDESYINQAIEDISKNLQKGDSVILRSTVPIGFTRKASQKIEGISRLIAGVDFNLGYAPERTVEGNAIKECMTLPQIYSGLTNRCSNAIQSIFKQITDSQIKLESIESCEMGKLISNAYRDVNFGFSNEISLIAKENNIDINRLIDNVNSGYPRNQIAQPSPGVGGPCLSKDSYMLMSKSFTDFSVIMSARNINEELPKLWGGGIADISKSLGITNILLIGLAFKGNPETNDTRNSPSVVFASYLKKEGFIPRIMDAIVTNSEIKQLQLCPFRETNKWRPELVCILNNHAKNIEIFNGILKNLKANSKLILFDPWYMCTNYYHDTKISEVLTLSKKFSHE